MRTLAQLVALTAAALAFAAEHKVHNIVLYPERHSWCQTTPIKQVVAMPGYEPLTIDNHVCVGACYSYSIPRTQPAEPGELIGPYCDSCQPKATQCYHVTLRRTPGPGAVQDEAAMRKRVQIITDCSCSSCGGSAAKDDCDLEDENTAELPASLVAVKDSRERTEAGAPEVPELLAMGSAPIATPAAQAISAETAAASTRTYHLSESMRQLLRAIQEESVPEHDENVNDEMRRLLDLVQGSDAQLSDRDVIEFVNWANEHAYDGDDSMELDALKLKDALSAFHRRELRQRHRKFGLGPAVASTLASAVEGSHLGLGHKKGAHIGMGMHPTHAKRIDDNIIAHDDGDDSEAIDEEKSEEVRHAHHSHQIGEAISAGGSITHLVMGPHGSLVLAAPDGREQLSLASDEMQPNEEGTVIDYHHHHHHHARPHPHRSTPPPL